MPSEETMCQETTRIEAKKIFGDIFNLSESRNNRDNPEKCLEWPEEIGNGFISMITLRPGIFLEIGNFRLREHITISFKQAHNSVSLVFSISGSIRRALDSEKGRYEYWSYTQGHSTIGYLPKHQQSIIKSSAGSRAYYVHITIDPLLLNSFMDGQYDQIPVALRNIVNGAAEQYFYQESLMNPSVNMAIHQIINCPYQSSLKRLFLEGKVLELISYSMAQSVSLGSVSGKNAELRPDDIERLVEARDILIHDLENPPSLLELARQVGTNKTTLNKGFRQLFGTSAFDYLRICRLERARELLDNKIMNVTEAAYSVGYSQHSSFTKAFKKHFGTNPKDHLH